MPESRKTDVPKALQELLAHALLESAPDAMVVKDRYGTIVMAMPGCVRFRASAIRCWGCVDYGVESTSMPSPNARQKMRQPPRRSIDQASQSH